VEEIIDYYLAIEEFFLRRSVDKAMKIDEYDVGNKTSSCVDDVFYILKKTISRAVNTSNVDCMAAMINYIKNTLEADYIAVFQRNMASVFSSGDTKEARFQYMVGLLRESMASALFQYQVTNIGLHSIQVLLNNINVSIDYLQKLTAEIEQESMSSITSLSEQALDKAKVVLSGLTASTRKFKQLLNMGIEELFERTLRPRLGPLLLDSYKGIKYIVTDEEYAEQESLNSFVHRLMSGIDALIEPLKVTQMSQHHTPQKRKPV